MRLASRIAGITAMSAAFILTAGPAWAAPPVDADGDGVKSNQDCNDSNPTIYPGAPEIECDGIDQDCNGVDSCSGGGCPDGDGDGYTDAACGGTDCNDADPAINPGAAETCGDGIDQNCDGVDPACGGTDPNHGSLLFADYPNNCLSCHNGGAGGTQFAAMFDSVHYKWVGDAPDMVNGPGLQQGKLTNSINNYCINIVGDWPVCGTCHTGRGKRPDDATAGVENIDCLVCHNEEYATQRVRLADGSMGVPAPADSMVRNIHQPTRTNCLLCHAKAGGGDAVKRGDLAMATATNADPGFDVHMNTTGADLACQACHVFQNHKVIGRGSDMRPTDDLGRGSEVKCVTCHSDFDTGSGHALAGSSKVEPDRHARRVACQSCHIPQYGKMATETNRDWRIHHDGTDATTCDATHPCPGHPHTDKAANLVPRYRFWNRQSDNALLGDDALRTYSASTNTWPISTPLGDLGSGKLTPFKYKVAVQPKTVADNRLIALDTLEYLKKSGNINTAIANGLVNMGYASSTAWEWITADTYQMLNHGVAPATSTTPCGQCHDGYGSNLDLATDSKLDALGYKLKDSAALICSQCHRAKSPKGLDSMHGHLNKGSGIGCYFCHDVGRPERGLCSPCDPACVSEFVDTNPYPHVCPEPGY